MRLIDADALRDDWLEHGENEYVYDTNAMLDSIDAQPTIEAVPVVHGRWEKHGKHDWWCTACKIGVPYSFTGFNYCHNCGARMDGGIL